MTKLLSHLLRPTNYESLAWHRSSSFPGARFGVRKPSLMQRLELTRQVKELTLRHEFLKAGDITDQLDATAADLLVRKLYLDWGLQQITGLQIDGRQATKDLLMEKGPEALVEEVLVAIQSELELSEDQRKNS